LLKAQRGGDKKKGGDRKRSNVLKADNGVSRKVFEDTVSYDCERSGKKKTTRRGNLRQQKQSPDREHCTTGEKEELGNPEEED